MSALALALHGITQPSPASDATVPLRLLRAPAPLGQVLEFPRAPQPVRARPAVRRISVTDADAFQQFVIGLSAMSRRTRFHGAVAACSPGLLHYLTNTDQVLHQAWVAVDAAKGAIVGEARFVASENGARAEFAIAVADAYQGKGLADELMATMVAVAAQAGIGALHGDVLEGNERMFGLLRRHRFERWYERGVEAGTERWQLRLQR